MATCIAKFRVNRYTKHATASTEDAACEVLLSPVYAPDEKDVNHDFWKASPAGELKMFVNNHAGARYVEERLGKDVYLTFSDEASG